MLKKVLLGLYLALLAWQVYLGNGIPFVLMLTASVILGGAIYLDYKKDKGGN